MEHSLIPCGGWLIAATGLVQAGSLLLGIGSAWIWPALLVGAFLAGREAWKRRLTLGRWLGLEHEICERIVITDPHGLHMRRCKDVVQVARKHMTYGIFLRAGSSAGKPWANARSVLSVQTLGVRGPVNGEAPPVVEVKVHGYRPKKVMYELRLVLEGEPNKYLSVYELSALVEKTGGKLVTKPLLPTLPGFARRISALKVRWSRQAGPLDSPGATGNPIAGAESNTIQTQQTRNQP